VDEVAPAVGEHVVEEFGDDRSDVILVLATRFGVKPL